MKSHLAAIKFTLMFLVLAGICNAAMDVSQFLYSKSIFSRLGNDRYFNPAISWGNKWRLDESGKPISGSERFVGSSTIFVKFTDFWHLAKSAMLTCIMLAVVFYRREGNWKWRIGDFLLCYIAFTGSFSVFYGLIFVAH